MLVSQDTGIFFYPIPSSHTPNDVTKSSAVSARQIHLLHLIYFLYHYRLLKIFLTHIIGFLYYLCGWIMRKGFFSIGELIFPFFVKSLYYVKKISIRFRCGQ